MSNAEWIGRHEGAMVLNYGKLPAVMVRGEGSLLWDADGKEYIDMFAGFGGTILGHANRDLVAAVTRQAEGLWAVGNQFYTQPQVILAQTIEKLGFAGRAFFCHSGAEANEAGIKLARLAGGVGENQEARSKKQEGNTEGTGDADGGVGTTGRYKIISMRRGFHGRTMGALSATPTVEYQRGFGPLVPGFVAVPFDDLGALEGAVDGETCGVIVEPIQGEGGIHVPSEGYLRGVREVCDRHKLTLIFDEVWTGCGRTGRMFGHQWWGVTPDIMTLGKALGGGLPVGAMVARRELAGLLKPGMHGCTLGGNPICAAAAATVLGVMMRDDLAARAAFLGERAMGRIREFKSRGKIKEVRGRGLMIGIELALADGGPVVAAALAKGVVINATQKNVLRLAPALTISELLLEKGLEVLEEVLGGF